MYNRYAAGYASDRPRREESTGQVPPPQPLPQNKPSASYSQRSGIGGILHTPLSKLRELVGGVFGDKIDMSDLLLILVLLLLYLEKEDDEILIILSALIVMSIM